MAGAQFYVCYKNVLHIMLCLSIALTYCYRLYGVEPLTPLRSIKAPLFGKCVAVSGTVVRVSCIRPLVTRMAFQCAICREVHVRKLKSRKIYELSLSLSLSLTSSLFHYLMVNILFQQRYHI